MNPVDTHVWQKVKARIETTGDPLPIEFWWCPVCNMISTYSSGWPTEKPKASITCNKQLMKEALK